ncbi:MAG: phage tail assembly protein [Pseudomonadota bacterium]
MAQITIPLQHGIKIGSDNLMEIVLREPLAGDIIEAQEESEKLVYAVEGNKVVPTLVASPTMVGVHVLRRQIVRIGKGDAAVQGPITLDVLKMLHPDDLDLLQGKANELDGATSAEAASREVAQRGRDDSDGQGA